MAHTLQLALPNLGTHPLPTEIRRRVYRVRLAPTPDGTYYFRSHSFTSRRGPLYRITINPRVGYATCSCPDYRYRRAEGTGVCKHLRRALATVARAERDRHPALRLEVRPQASPVVPVAAPVAA